MAGVGARPQGTTRRLGALQRRNRQGFYYVLPAVILIALFFLVPLAFMFMMSLTDWPLLGAVRFVGVSNYVSLVKDRTFTGSLLFTLKYAVVVTPLLLVVGLGLALLVKTNRPGVKLFRAAYFMPLVIGLAAASYLWVWLLNPQVGFMDRVIHDALGVHRQIQWLAEPRLAFAAVVYVVVWKTVGFSMILLVGGLQGIPLEVNEAAAMDGAGRIRKFWRITLPLVRRTIALVLVFATVGSFLAFEQFYIMTKGGPGNATMTVVYWIFNTSFFGYRLGYGASASVILLVVLVALASIEMYLIREENAR